MMNLQSMFLTGHYAFSVNFPVQKEMIVWMKGL